MKLALVLTALLTVQFVSGQTKTSSTKPKAVYRISDTTYKVSDTTQFTIKNFFIPDLPNNRATFYTPDNTTGGQTSMTRMIYYVRNGSFLDIIDTHMFDGQPSSIVTRIVQFTSNEVKMVKSVLTSVGVTNKKQSYNPPQTLLKMPAAGQTISWTFTDFAGDTYKCTASWVIVSIDGKQRKAIRVNKAIPGLTAREIEYYVSGIGFWKSDIQSSDGKIQTADKFDELEYDPTVTAQAEEGTNKSQISKYENLVIKGQTPSDASVQTKYDDRDYHAIFWGDKLSNASMYARQEIEKLGYEYIKITDNDNQHITYTYRNCKKNLLLEITEWYNYKISVDIQWFSNAVKGSTGYLMFCN